MMAPFTADRNGTGRRSLFALAAIVAALLLIGPETSSPEIPPGGPREASPVSRKPDPLPLPEPDQFPATLSPGIFLVAGRNLRDPRFRETVVLLVSYRRLGAVGLIINRPTRLSLSAAFPDIPSFKKRTDVIYFGGPVEGDQVLLLVRSPGNPGEAARVFDGVYVSSSMAVLNRMATQQKAGEHFRVYAGYAGWAPGQLEGEIARGDWRVLPADAKTLFEKDVETIWPEMIRRSSELQVWDAPSLVIEAA